MTLWVIFGLMTATAVFAVVWPLVRYRTAARSGSDIAVYRDQLDEVGRDLATGLIGKTEAQAARVEISRRLLAADAAAQAAPAASSPVAAAWRRRAVVLVALVLLPAGAAALYLRIGSPDLASATVAAEQTVAPGQEASVATMVAKVEAHLQQNPKDGRGWEVLAPVYLQIGRYADSVNAWRNTLQLLGENADRLANLGESLMAEANGIVTADAKAAFVRAVTLDSTTVSARYYLGIAAEQDGQRDKAAKIWRDLIADAPPGAHWLSQVRTALARVDGKAPATPPGLNAAQLAVAGKQPPGQQSDQPPAPQPDMIRGMVDRLAARLKKDGSDPDGWVRLVRSYKVLGEPDKATAAAADARKALAGDSGKLQQLETALKDLAAENTPAPSPAPAPSPNAAQMAAAGKQPPAQQADMIRGMVDRLAARLKKDGSDPDGWVRLVRSYKVLGEPDKATAAAADARQVLASDPAKLKQFETGLKDLDAGKTAASAPMPAPAPMPNAGTAPGHQQDAQSMVEHLAERLKKSGSDPQGWLMLTRSYLTLGEKDKATAAINDGRRALTGDPAKLAEFNEALKRFKINE
jgi:cytochrome c-type biogenesis protein CcmH